MTQPDPDHLPGEHLQVTVDEVIFASAGGRYAVLRVFDTRLKEVVAYGDLGGITRGETLRLRGTWTDHPTYGRRFRVDSFVPVLPTTPQGIVKYLGSGLVPGVGPAIAERIVERFGERTLDIICTQSAKLTEISGIGKKRALSIADTIRTRRIDAEAMTFFQGLGLGPALSRKVLREHGENAIRIAHDDPYRLADTVRGLAFRTADRMGRAQGIADDDPRRARGAMQHLLKRANDDGHVFALREDLIRQGGSMGISATSAEDALLSLETDGAVVREEQAVYLPACHRAEARLAELLGGLLSQPKRDPKSSAVIGMAGEHPLTETQRNAVERSIVERLLVLTGGPGTGKTTTVRAIVETQRAAGKSMVLCAPTGRAAKRLSEATGQEAKTIHRLLEWNPATGRFQRDQHNPLAADVVLVDEASMLDLMLGWKLVEAVAKASTLILVGDVDQLPPVGAGHVLRELIASERAPVIRLDQVFRQAQQSAIVRGAHAILHGDRPELSPPHAQGLGEIYRIRADTPEAAIDRVLAALGRAEKAYGLDPRTEVQVLTPTRRGPLGTEVLNPRLQQALHPSPPSTPGALIPGDKVMQLRNDYDRNVYNGDLGVVTQVDEEQETLVVRFDEDVVYEL
ncbi:MAG: AAA family ATPase, partial [Myxococcales bacterium]|nr:AAA family ATPase [Myxococcales bacterium]